MMYVRIYRQRKEMEVIR